MVEQNIGTKPEDKTLKIRKVFDDQTAEALYRKQEDEKKKRPGGEADPGLG
jgi:hypothetical protein